MELQTQSCKAVLTKENEDLQIIYAKHAEKFKVKDRN